MHLQPADIAQVAIHVLHFLNELVTLSVKALGSSALLGVVLAAAKYAVNGGPLGNGPSPDARLQAAYFLQYLAETNLLTAQLLLTCQVISCSSSQKEREFEMSGMKYQQSRASKLARRERIYLKGISSLRSSKELRKIVGMACCRQ